jgi:prepilin-type N-terminal cleavage/methylation domain-containing protein
MFIQGGVMKKAFTFIEIIIVVVIITIIAALGYPQYKKIVTKSRSGEAIDFINTIRQLEVSYHAQYGAFAEELNLLIDIGLASSQRSKLFDYGITNNIGYYGYTAGNGGPDDYQGYTVAAWTITSGAVYGGPPQYHIHEQGSIAETNVPNDSTMSVLHSHGTYTHTHNIPQT